MPRVVSFIVLLAILLLVSAVFFQVMAHFVVPLFLAAVLVVVFKPLHSWVLDRVPGYPRLAALATTLLILLMVLLPTVWLGWKAGAELRDVYSSLKPASEGADFEIVANPGDEEVNVDVETAPDPEGDKFLEQIATRAPGPVKDAFKALTGDVLDAISLRPAYIQARKWIGSIAVSGAQIVLKLLFSMAIMVLALYYFLADGPRMLANMMKLSPLDDEYERELLDKFANVSRAVVVASLASAVAQALLAGIGYAFALNPGAPIFLLTMLTMVLAIVPFAGAAAIWIPTAAWIYLYQPTVIDGQTVQGNPFVGLCLAAYGALVVSTVDNLIKPLVLHGQSNLHPLVALISILGGVQTLGPIGILVGPMLVAFIQALLNMVNKELHRLGDGTLETKHGARGLALPLATAAGVRTPGAAEVAPAGDAPADTPPGRVGSSLGARTAASLAAKRRRRKK